MQLYGRHGTTPENGASHSGAAPTKWQYSSDSLDLKVERHRRGQPSTWAPVGRCRLQPPDRLSKHCRDSHPEEAALRFRGRSAVKGPVTRIGLSMPLPAYTSSPARLATM